MVNLCDFDLLFQGHDEIATGWVLAGTMHAKYQVAIPVHDVSFHCGTSMLLVWTIGRIEG